MNQEQIIHNIKALYLVHNDFQLWAWIFTACALLFLIKPTRRFGGGGILVALGCMGIFFAVRMMMHDFAPPDPDIHKMERAKSHR